MKFDIKGVVPGTGLDNFRTAWIEATMHENSIILGDGENRISQAQLLVINLFCNLDEGYSRADDMIVTTHGDSQAELEALFRGRGRALAALMFTSEED